MFLSLISGNVAFASFASAIAVLDGVRTMFVTLCFALVMDLLYYF